MVCVPFVSRERSTRQGKGEGTATFLKKRTKVKPAPHRWARPQRIRPPQTEKRRPGPVPSGHTGGEEHLLVRVVPQRGKALARYGPVSGHIDGVVLDARLLGVEADSVVPESNVSMALKHVRYGVNLPAVVVRRHVFPKQDSSHRALSRYIHVSMLRPRTHRTSCSPKGEAPTHIDITQPLHVPSHNLKVRNSRLVPTKPPQKDRPRIP